MQVTIATQNRPDIDRDHNLRTPERVANEKHINPDGEHETWRDEEIRAAYDRIFGEALTEYNAKQSRNDRKIKDYYEHISKDKKKQPVYEMIAGVYNTELDRDTKYKILREFCDSWEMRNPNLVCVGMYWHADEKGQEHVHIDYIPVGTKYTKGMAVQNSLTKAFNEMGFKTRHSNLTAQMQWEKRENTVLEQICNSYSLDVIHPNAKRPHLDKETFIEYRQMMDEAKIEAENIIFEAQDIADKVTADTAAKQAELEKLENDISDAKNTIRGFNEKIISQSNSFENNKKVLQNQKKTFENVKAEISDLQDNKEKLNSDIEELEIIRREEQRKIDEERLKGNLTDEISEKFKSVLEPLELDKRFRKIKKIKPSKYKTYLLDSKMCLVPKDDLTDFYDFGMSKSIKDIVKEAVTSLTAIVNDFINTYVHKIEELDSREAAIERKERRTDRLLEEAEKEYKDGREYREKAEDYIYAVANEKMDKFIQKAGTTPDESDMGHRAIEFIRAHGLGVTFELEEREYLNKLAHIKENMDIDWFL